MSGPKYSSVYLDDHYFDIINEEEIKRRKEEAERIQRELEAEKKRIELEKLKNAQEELRKMICKYMKKLNEYKVKLSEMMEISNSTSYKDFESAVNFAEKFDSGIPEEITKVKAKESVLNELFKNNIMKLDRSIDKCKEKQKVKEIANYSGRNEKQQVISFSFTESNEDECEVDTLLEEVSLICSDNWDYSQGLIKLSDSLKKAVKNGKKSEIKHLKGVIESEISSVKRRQEHLDAEYCKYVACARVNGFKPEDKRYFTTIEEIEADKKRKLIKCKEKFSMQYIAETINEVMIESGYPLINKNDVLTEDKEYREYYRFDSDSFIRISKSESGSIVMDIAMEDKSGNDISEEEKCECLEKQIKFCEQYPELIKKLERKGIKFSDRTDLLPDKAYAVKVKIKSDIKSKKVGSRRFHESKGGNSDGVCKEM